MEHKVVDDEIDKLRHENQILKKELANKRIPHSGSLSSLSPQKEAFDNKMRAEKCDKLWKSLKSENQYLWSNIKNLENGEKTEAHIELEEELAEVKEQIVTVMTERDDLRRELDRIEGER